MWRAICARPSTARMRRATAHVCDAGRLGGALFPAYCYPSAHLHTTEKQGTSPSSRFLAACKAYIAGEMAQEQLLDTTVRLGFQNVIDAFHVVNRADTPVRFFTDERAGRTKGLALTEDLLRLAQQGQHVNLPHEIEGRWRLVETAWTLNISRHLMTVQYDRAAQALFTIAPSRRRVTITSCRNALNGYQKGKCFYCFADIAIDDHALNLADVDHFLPHTLKQFGGIPHLDGVWNLVLACPACNRGMAGKFTRLPALKYLTRLHTRNEFLIASHHPLRETLIRQTGMHAQGRADFLQSCYATAQYILLHPWEAPVEHAPAF